MLPKNRITTHPGIFLKDLIKEYNISIPILARDLKIPTNRLYELIKKKRAITADTALRLGQYFNMAPEFWMNAQNAYDITSVLQTHEFNYKSIHPITSRVENVS